MDLNLECEHQTNEIFGPFCLKCGAVIKTCIEMTQKIFTVKYKSFIYKPDIPPLELFAAIEKQIGYKIYFKKVKANMSDFYKKARISCIKFIKKLVEEYKFSTRTYFMAVFYLDLIYLNYDYYSILKDFKSELISLGCVLVAGKILYII